MEIYRRAHELDYDRTLAAGFAKAPPSILALIAFNAELAAIRGKVTDPITFEMRLLWWAEAVKDFEHRKIRKHPIVEALDDGWVRGELDEILLDLMVRNRFKEFSEKAGNFDDFIEQRRDFLEPFYMNAFLSLRGDERAGDRDIFLGFDILKVLQNIDFYQTRGMIPFRGEVDAKRLQGLLSAVPGHPFFKGLRVLARWHLKRLEKTRFRPDAKAGPPQHPGKILHLWAAKWL